MKRQLLYGAVFSLATIVSVSAPLYATSSHNPGGNNGFVKINNETVPDSIPQNHPHVSCTFSVEFYNYDENNTKATVNFTLQAPTNKDNKLTVASGNLSPFIGGDAAGGGKDLDAREQYKLMFTGSPQQNQGYHVKMTVNAPGSKGSDVKHKVFWVEPCKTTLAATGTKTTTPTIPSEQANALVLPAELPKTGLGSATFLGGVFASALSYVLALRLRKQSSTQL